MCQIIRCDCKKEPDKTKFEFPDKVRFRTAIGSLILSIVLFLQSFLTQNLMQTIWLICAGSLLGFSATAFSAARNIHRDNSEQKQEGTVFAIFYLFTYSVRLITYTALVTCFLLILIEKTQISPLIARILLITGAVITGLTIDDDVSIAKILGIKR